MYKISFLDRTSSLPYISQLQTDDISNILHSYLNICKEKGTIIGCSKYIHKSIKLICFDMDSTLIKIEILDELADIMGIGEQMRKITAQTMYGELNFKDSFLQRVRLLKGLSVNSLNNLAQNMPIADGLQILMEQLKEKRIKTAIITGNFSCFGKFLQLKYGFDYIFTTEAEIEQNKFLSGNIKGKIIDGLGKAEILLALCKKENITPSQCIAVGDGANDIPMLIAAGTGIIYNATVCGDITRIMD
ncbi:MAG: phosphoserine phosphatase SerB [Bacteroidales bacterium]